MTGLRLLVCGGRDFQDREWAYHVLDRFHAKCGPVGIVIHGAAKGADSLGEEWAVSRCVASVGYNAHWQRDGRAAGPIRNQRMLDEGRPSVVLAFPGGRGTADMVARARKAGLTVYEIPPRPSGWTPVKHPKTGPNVDSAYTQTA